MNNRITQKRVSELPAEKLEKIKNCLDIGELWQEFASKTKLMQQDVNRIVSKAGYNSKIRCGHEIISLWITRCDPFVNDLFDLMGKLGRVQEMELLLENVPLEYDPHGNLAAVRRRYQPPQINNNNDNDNEEEEGEEEDDIVVIAPSSQGVFFNSSSAGVQVNDSDGFVFQEHNSINSTRSIANRISSDETQSHIVSLSRSLSPQMYERLELLMQRLWSSPVQELQLHSDNQMIAFCLGRFAKIYQVRYACNLCVVKQFQFGSDEDAVARLEHASREVSACATFRHLNLLPLMGYFLTESALHLVYPFMPGGTLGQRLHDYDKHQFVPLDLHQRMLILRGIGEALAFLHAATCPLVHGDVSAANVLLDSLARPYLSDLGLSRVAGETLQSVSGTPGYIPPEACHQKRAQVESDVYALGVVTLEISCSHLTPLRPCGEANSGNSYLVQPVADWLHAEIAARNLEMKNLNRLLSVSEDGTAASLQLCQQIPPEFHIVLESLLKLAVCCTFRDLQKRITAVNFVSLISKIEERFV